MVLIIDSFYEWIKSIYADPDKLTDIELRDLATSIIYDNHFPKGSTDRKIIRTYIWMRGGSKVCMDCLDRALTLYYDYVEKQKIYEKKPEPEKRYLKQQ